MARAAGRLFRRPPCRPTNGLTVPVKPQTLWCTQCKRDRPATEFLTVRRGWKVDKCNRCACENMGRYWRKHESDPDKVRRAGLDE